MIKLKNLLKEEQFTARAKDSGKLVYFKTKDSRDAAIKQGTHTDPEKETKPQQPTTQKPAGADLFGKDYQTARGGAEAPTKQYDTSGETDYFDKYDELPDNISNLIGKYFPEGDEQYSSGKLEKIKSNFEKQGWTFDYGMDGTPYELKPLNASGTSASATPKAAPTPKYDLGVDSVVYNKRTNTVGIVRLGDERGETKTDADGNVNTDELEPYNPMKFPHQKDAQVAPSTKKEIESRGLFNPFSQKNDPVQTQQPKSDGMETVKAIASQTGLRAQAVAGWADENGVNLSKVADDLKSRKLKPMDLMTAVVGNPGNKYEKQIISKYSNKGATTQSTTSLKSLMPNADFKKKTLDDVDPLDKQTISMTIAKLAKMGEEAKAKGEKAPNYNLCQVTIPGTNLYCDDNKGIPRADMPQFKGVPEAGSPADKLPKDNNGEADTEEFFKQMLNKEGINVSEPVSVRPDRLKATQSELVGVKVAGMSKVLEDKNHPAYNKITAPIYVSNDGYVLDGHHRWAAVVAHNAANPNDQIPMNVRVIDEPIVPLVKRSNDFAEKIGIRPKAADTGASGGKVESVDEAQMHAQTQRVSLDAIRQLKVNLKQEKDLIKLLDLLDKKIRKYEPW